jgi:hypothetical protein
MTRQERYPQELRERAVRMVLSTHDRVSGTRTCSYLLVENLTTVLSLSLSSFVSPAGTR